MNRWMAVLSSVTTFGILSGGDSLAAPEVRKRADSRRHWETEWAADGGRLLRILKAL